VGKDLFVVAKIRKSFGLNGEVAVESFTHSLERFNKLKKVFIGYNENDLVECSVSSVRTNKDMIILKIDLFKDRSDSDKFAGSFIYVDSKNIIKPPRGKFFYHDIIGLSVEDSDGKKYGEVKDVWQTPANDVYVIDYNGKEVLLPAIKEFIKKIDINSKKIIIEIVAGLFESQV
jgi:16S rRNA processing protein RimM